MNTQFTVPDSQFPIISHLLFFKLALAHAHTCKMTNDKWKMINTLSGGLL